MGHALIRLLQLLPILLFVVALNFTLLHFAPGDPAVLLAGADAPREYIAAVRERYGLDLPFHEQLFRYLGRVATGDFGYSFTYNAPALEIITERLGATFLLMGTALLIGLVVGVNLGVLASLRPNSGFSTSVMVSAVVVYAMPEFWVGILAMIVFGLWLGWFPTQGMGGIGLSGWAYVSDVAAHLVLPAMVIGLRQAAVYSRLTRASMLEILGEDYIRTARGKGVHFLSVVYRHALRNSLLAIVTMVGLRFRLLLSGAVLVEVIFGWPGIGSLTYVSIFNRDIYLLMNIFLTVSVVTFLASLVTDLVYVRLDPRIKFE